MSKSFELLALTYLERQKERMAAGTYDRVSKIIRANLIPFFGARTSVDQITAERMSEYMSARSRLVSSASISKEISVLRSMFETARDLELTHVNPAMSVKHPRDENRRDIRYLNMHEVRQIISHCPEWMRVLTEFALWTGLRRGELTALRWGDVSGDSIRVRMDKEGLAERNIPLSKAAQGVLAPLRRSRPAPTETVFPSPPATDANISVQFLRASRRAGFHATFQAIRHTAMSLMLDAGIDLNTVSTYFGYSRPESTARYAPTSAVELRSAAGALERAGLDGTRNRT